MNFQKSKISGFLTQFSQFYQFYTTREIFTKGIREFKKNATICNRLHSKHLSNEYYIFLFPHIFCYFCCVFLHSLCSLLKKIYWNACTLAKLFVLSWSANLRVLWYPSFFHSIRHGQTALTFMNCKLAFKKGKLQ